MRPITEFAKLKERYERSQKKRNQKTNPEIITEEEDYKNTTEHFWADIFKRENSETPTTGMPSIKKNENRQASTNKTLERKEDLSLNLLDESIKDQIEENEKKLSTKNVKDISSILQEQITNNQTNQFISDTKQIIAQKVFEALLQNMDQSLKNAHSIFTEKVGIAKRPRSKSESGTNQSKNKPTIKHRSKSEDGAIDEAITEQTASFKQWKEQNPDIVNKKNEYNLELTNIGNRSDYVMKFVNDYYVNIFNNLKEKAELANKQEADKKQQEDLKPKQEENSEQEISRSPKIESATPMSPNSKNNVPDI